jgi:hypothetical protein
MIITYKYYQNYSYNYVKDILKEAKACKPKLVVKERAMEPDEEAYLRLVRTDQSNMGTVDPTDHFVSITKKNNKSNYTKGTPRRFVGGNTAFKTMANLPILIKSEMITVPLADRNRVFKTIQSTDKYNSSGKKDAEADDDDGSQEDELDPDANDILQTDSSGRVVFWWMELHPKAWLAVRAMKCYPI